MKHIVIGDLHGKSVWQDVDISKYDKIVFMGDYVDSFTLPDLVIDLNLQDIIALKKKHPEKVVLLLGNHDVQYMYYPQFQCSGFRDSMRRPLHALFNYNKDLFQVAYQCGNYLFTHAGLTNAWYLQFMALPRWQKAGTQPSLADLLNKANEGSDRYLLHNAGASRGGAGHGGITWADKSETDADMLIGYHQIVGHTPLDEVYSLSYGDTSVTYVDVLDKQTYFHEIDC